MTAASIAEEVFERLGVACRKTAFPDGNLYFCTAADGQTFDAFIENEETIRLWRFISACPVEYAGTRIEFRAPKDPCSAFIFEINEEGELFFCAEGFCGPGVPERRRKTRELVRIFSETEINPESVIPWLIAVS